MIKKSKETSATAATLRQQAENKLLEREFGLSDDVEVSSPETIKSILHELRVHQIELEMQNDELRQAQQALELSNSRYFELYDLAPAGYVTLSDKGIILQANLTAASMLGVNRTDLERNLLSNFILKDDQDIFYKFRAQLVKTREQQKFEVRMKKINGVVFWVQVDAAIAENDCGAIKRLSGNTNPMDDSKSFLRIILVDISSIKKKETDLKEAHWRLESIIRGTRVGTWEWNVHTGEMEINELWAAMVGYTVQELSPVNIDTWRRLTHPEDLVKSAEILNNHFSGKSSGVDYQYRMQHKNGSWVWIHYRGQLITRTTDGQPWMMFGTHTDITERIKMEEALKESNERFSNMFEKHHSMMLLIDSKTGAILDANKAAEYFYGYPRSIIKNMSIFNLNVLPHDQVLAEMQRAMEEQKNFFIFTHRLSSGEEAVVEVHSTPIMISEKELLFSIIHDITDRKKTEDQLQSVHKELEAALIREKKVARTDVLTGINNRRSLFEIAEQQFETAKRYEQPLSIIMLDIDHFKVINDTFGHTIGDQMLQRVTQIAREELRTSDEIGRIGGEEFVIVLPMTTAENAALLAERIRSKVENTRISTENGEASVTLSIGIAEIDLQSLDETADSLIHRADIVMYKAKNAGRNQVKIAAS